MGVSRYRARGVVLWEVDVWLGPPGRQKRFRRGQIATRGEAERLLLELKTGKVDVAQPEAHALQDAWALYLPVCQRDCRAWKTDLGRAKSLLRHLGHLECSGLTNAVLEAYRARRSGEKTARGKEPSPALLDREVELLKRVLNHSVACGMLTASPLGGLRLLRKTNTRSMVVDEAAFQCLLSRAGELRNPILLAFDTGMREREVLELRWGSVDLPSGVIRLRPQETKTQEARVLALTARTRAMLSSLPNRGAECWVFPRPQTGKPWRDFRKSWRRITKEAGLEGLWFHDLRRSFVTKARRAGIPESVIMRISGHRTRSVFDRYNIVDESDLHRAAVVLDAL